MANGMGRTSLRFSAAFAGLTIVYGAPLAIWYAMTQFADRPGLHEEISIVYTFAAAHMAGVAYLVGIHYSRLPLRLKFSVPMSGLAAVVLTYLTATATGHDVVRYTFLLALAVAASLPLLLFALHHIWWHLRYQSRPAKV